MPVFVLVFHWGGAILDMLSSHVIQIGTFDWSNAVYVEVSLVKKWAIALDSCRPEKFFHCNICMITDR